MSEFCCGSAYPEGLKFYGPQLIPALSAPLLDLTASRPSDKASWGPPIPKEMPTKEEISLEQAQEQAQEYLGDKVYKTLNKTALAALVKKYIPNCNCGGRRSVLNALHKRLLFSIKKELGNDG